MYDYAKIQNHLDYCLDNNINAIDNCCYCNTLLTGRPIEKVFISTPFGYLRMCKKCWNKAEYDRKSKERIPVSDDNGKVIMYDGNGNVLKNFWES